MGSYELAQYANGFDKLKYHPSTVVVQYWFLKLQISFTKIQSPWQEMTLLSTEVSGCRREEGNFVYEK
jgi:hypothetical protein